MPSDKREELRAEVFAIIGEKCACPPCGESNISFLSLDHIDNDGNAHREYLAGQDIYTWALEDPSAAAVLQTMCYNCNMGRANNDGVCPHGSQPAWRSKNAVPAKVARAALKRQTAQLIELLEFEVENLLRQRLVKMVGPELAAIDRAGASITARAKRVVMESQFKAADGKLWNIEQEPPAETNAEDAARVLVWDVE